MASSSELVTLRGGLVAHAAVITRLLALEARGATFALEPEGRFRVMPSTALTEEDKHFLRDRRDEARALIEYILVSDLPM